LAFMHSKAIYNLTEKQIEATHLLTNDKRFTLLYGGSRSGKTWLLCNALCIRAVKASGSRHIILRHAFNHVKTSIWLDTLPKVIETCFPDLQVKWNKSDFFIQFPNESELWIGGLDDKLRVEKILGKEYSTIYFNEASQTPYESYTTALTRLAQKTTLKNKIYIDCNPPPITHWIHKVFMEYVDPISGEKN